MLRSELDGLVARRTRFESLARALSPAQLAYRPRPGAWSIAEVAQHVLHVEREVTRAAAKPGVSRRGRKRTPREWVRFAAFLGVFHLRAKIRVPRQVASLVTPGTYPDIDKIWSEWKQVHADLGQYLDTITAAQLNDMAFKHPIMGPTKVRSMLPFLRRHFDHHMRQVNRIRRSGGFPDA